MTLVDAAVAISIDEPSRPDGHGSDGALDTWWRRFTGAGNRAIAERDDVTASRLFREALAEAERLFDLALAGDGPPMLLAPMVHNVACCNVAEAMKQAGDDAGARDFKLRALEKLVTVAESAASPLVLRVNCVRHLKYALAFLAEDLTGSEPDKEHIKGLVARAQAVAAEVFRIAGHVIKPEPYNGGAGSHRPYIAPGRTLQ